MASPCNIIQDKYNQDQYKGENQNFIYCPILGYYNNWQIIYCGEIIKQLESTHTGINFQLKHNAISIIALNIGKDISDNHYVEISTIDKNAEN